MEILEEAENTVYVPPLGIGLAMLISAYGPLSVLISAVLAILVPARRRLPPPPEPMVPPYGPVGFIHFD